MPLTTERVRLMQDLAGAVHLALSREQALCGASLRLAARGLEE